MAKKRKKDRTCHYLRPNHGTAVPRNLVFVQVRAQEAPDTTSAGGIIQRLDFGVAHGVRWQDGRIQRWSQLTFNTAAQFWAWFVGRQRTRTGLWLIGHQIAQAFTLLEGWDQLDKRNYSLVPHKFASRVLANQEGHEQEYLDGWFVDADPPTIILLHHELGVIHVVDIRNYGDCTIEELAAETGIAVPELPAGDASFVLWQNAINQRVRCVRQYFLGLMEFWQENDLGCWRHTIASLALSAYRHRFMNFPILVHNDERILKLEREALAGGEFRSFYAGKVAAGLGDAGPYNLRGAGRRRGARVGPIYRYDVNGLYPSVMRDNVFPRELCCWKSEPSIDDYLTWRSNLCLIAHVQVESVADTYPIVYEGERYWAVGKFWSTLAGPELHQAVERGHVRQWGSLVGYYRSKLFTDYIAFFQALRLKAKDWGKALQDRAAKLMMVSLAGKFGQRSPQWEFVKWAGLLEKKYGTFPVVSADGEIHTYRAISGHVQIHEFSDEALESAPAIEAYINAYGRDFMARVRSAIGAQHIFYQGSDALYLDQVGAELITPWCETYPYELGKFRASGKWTHGEFRGPHDYTLDGEITVAGRKAEAHDDGEGYYTQREAERLTTIVLRQPGGYCRVKEVKKSWGGIHPKGIWNKDGSVSPPQMVDGVLHFDRKHPQSYPQQPDDTRR